MDKICVFRNFLSSYYRKKGEHIVWKPTYYMKRDTAQTSLDTDLKPINAL